MRTELIDKVVQRLAALADATRLRLLLRLREGPCHVTALAAELGVAQASVSKHLAVLRQVGLVEVERRGAQAIYSVSDESIFEICGHLCDGVVRHMEKEHEALGLGRASTTRPRRNGKRKVRS